MSKLCAAFVLVAALGVATPPPAAQHPPGGTYHYTLTANGKTAYDSSIVFATAPEGFIETERADVSGKKVTTKTVFDMRAMRVLRHTINVVTLGGTQAVVLTFGNAYASLDAPPVRLSAAAGTTVLAPEEGLAEFWALAPVYARLAGWKPFSLVALNAGANVYLVTPSIGTDAKPSDLPGGDVELVLTVNNVAHPIWYDPDTLIVEQATLTSGVLRLAAKTLGRATPAAIQTPAGAATPLPLPPAHYAEKAIAFSSKGATLRGVLDMPRKAQSVAAIVFVHGSGAATRDGGTFQNPTFKILANALTNAGIAVLRYDKRGVGESTGTGTEDWRVLQEDIKAAVAFLEKQPGIDRKRIFALGHSEGGFIVPEIAGELTIRGIIVMAGPAVPMEQILGYQLKDAPATEKQAIVTGLASYTGIDPASVIAKVRVPMLLLQGGKDGQILATDFPRLVKAAKATSKEVTARIFPEDDHLFIVLPSTQKMQEARELFEPHRLDPRVAAAIATWISKH